MIIASQQTESLTQKAPLDESITIESGAQLNHVLLGSGGILDVYVKKDALYAPFLLSDNSEEQTLIITVHLEEPGAEVDLKGLLIGKKKQSIIHQITIKHLAQYTTSTQYLKTIADDQASIQADATIEIHREAAHSSADQLAKNLVLSSEAETKTEPKLKIDNNEVKASHGTSVGALDQKALFYLQARGIGKLTAQAMLKKAFIEDIITSIPDKETRALVRAQHAVPHRAVPQQSQ